jgi:hypothetical protein
VVEITHGGYRCFIIPVDPIPDANPEHNEYTSKANKAEGKAACFNSYPPQSCDECVHSKYLVRCASIRSKIK